MKLTAAIIGSFEKGMRAEIGRIERAIPEGLRAAGGGLQGELRGQVTGAGLGQRLANTWRSRTYINLKHNAAALVWSKAPHLIRLYDKGAIIRSRQGFYLAIPTPAAGRFGDRRQKITPGAWDWIHGMRLRFVYRRSGPSLLVAENVRLTARGRAAANIGRSKGAAYSRLSGRTTVPLFILVPQVSVKKRLDVSRAARRWVAQTPQLIRQAIAGQR